MSRGKTSKKEDVKTVNDLTIEIANEAKRLAKNEVTSCYTIIEKAKELIALEKFNTPSNQE